MPSQTRRAFDACRDFEFLLPDWFLAGGTALALQIGHRSSEDLDFFTLKKDFDIAAMENLISKHGDWKRTLARQATLWGNFKNAKISFISYRFYKPSAARLQCDNIHLLLPDDIMAMKILAISQRGKKRDFVDMYWYCAISGASIAETIRRAIAQFPGRKHNVPHLIKSLTYFEDAESDPMPQLFIKVDWKEIKAYFRREMPNVAKELLHIKD